MPAIECKRTMSQYNFTTLLLNQQSTLVGCNSVKVNSQLCRVIFIETHLEMCGKNDNRACAFVQSGKLNVRQFKVLHHNGQLSTETPQRDLHHIINISIVQSHVRGRPASSCKVSEFLKRSLGSLNSCKKLKYLIKNKDTSCVHTMVIRR